MKKIDAIIVGASNSGLMAGLELLNEGYRVLVLDEHNNIGESSKVVRVGRFNFDLNDHGYYLGDSDRSYRLDNLLQKVGVEDEIYLTSLESFYTVICGDEEYTMPFGLDAFKEKMEEYVPGSLESMDAFINLASECGKAMEFIVDNIGKEISYDEFKENYSNFIKVAPCSVSTVLDSLGMPLKAQEILNACWMYFASSEVEISFVQYAMFIYDAISNGLYIPVNGSYDVTMLLSQAFLEKGGEIKLNSKVDKILVEDGKVTGVKLNDNTVYYSNIVIASSMESKVYREMIEPSDIPRDALKSINKREIGPSKFTVNLGINRSIEELGLQEYSYLLYDSLDSDMVMTKLQEPNNSNEMVTVTNVINPDISDKGTSIINLSTLIVDSIFDNYIDESNYQDYLIEEANRLINRFEKNTKIRIKDYIEEINIISPVRYSYINKEHNGSMFGYKLKGLDNIVPRIMNYKNELYIKGLYLCGGFMGDAFGYDSDIMSGYIAAKVAMNRTEE